MSGALQKFWNLSGADRRLIRDAGVLLVAMRLGLLLLPFKALRRFTGGGEPSHLGTVSLDPADRDAAARIAWAVSAMARRIPGKMTCLVQALAAERLLRKRGYHPVLRIGVLGRNGAAAIKAHAWVECGGRVVIGEIAELERYAILSAPTGRME